MKRLLTFFIISILVPCLSGFSAYAYDREPVRAEIEAEITLGGTAAIIPNVNSPVPEKTEINLKDGETGRFYIDFTEVGVYDYSVKEVPDDRNLNFDKTVYSIKVYVTDEDGTLTAAVIASKTGDESSQKLQRLVFVNTLPGEDETTSVPPEDNTVVPEGKNKNPQTGDDTKMELYFLLAILASAGLLAISIFYLIDTQKMINSKKNK